MPHLVLAVPLSAVAGEYTKQVNHEESHTLGEPDDIKEIIV